MPHLNPNSKPYFPQKPTKIAPIIVPIGVHLLRPNKDPIIYKKYTKKSLYGVIGQKKIF